MFNAELLQKRKLEIIEQILNTRNYKQGMFSYEAKFSEDGERISVMKIGFVESKTGHVKIYKEPVEGHPYVVVNDPANGGEDYFATQIWDNYTGKQVAVYHRNKVDIDDCAFQMYCLLRYYNGCLSNYPEIEDDSLASGETNTTSYVLEMLHKMGYRNIYKDTDVQDLSNRFMNKYGFMTKTNNRQYMIDLFKVAFRKNPEIISDYETICEMENFEIVKHASGKEKAEAANGSHDDLVMSCCGFFYCRDRQRAYVSVNTTVKPKNPFDPLEEDEPLQERNVYQIWD